MWFSPSTATTGLEASLAGCRLSGGRWNVTRTKSWNCCSIIICRIRQIQRTVWRIPILHVEFDPNEIILGHTLWLQICSWLDPSFLVDPLGVRDVVAGTKNGARFSPRDPRTAGCWRCDQHPSSPEGYSRVTSNTKVCTLQLRCGQNSHAPKARGEAATGE